MKRLSLILIVMISMVALADMEHRPGQGEPPAALVVNQSRACFLEIQRLGCRHPSEDPAGFPACLDQKLDLLTDPCRTVLAKLYR